MSSPFTSNPPAEATRSGISGRTAVLLLVCVAQFMLLIDDTIVNVALPSISTSLHLGESNLSWITNAYLLTFGGFLLIGGRVADMIGRRKVFSLAMTAFFVASAVCGLAPSSTVLIIARGVQGLAGAFMSPAALSILLATFREEKERTRSLAVWTSLTALGATTGLLVGGALVQTLDWRWIFWINLPIGLATLFAVPRVIPNDDDQVRSAAPGVASPALITASLLALVFTVVDTDTHSWTSAHTIVGLAASVVLAGVFVLRERRADEPLVARSIVKLPNIPLGNVYMFGAASALLAMFFFLTLYMQQVLGYSAMKTGLSYLPFSFTLGITSGVTAKLIERFSAVPFLVAGPLVAAAGMWLMHGLDVSSSYSADLLPSLMLVAAGFGLAFVPLLGVATKGAPERDSGVASGLVTSSQQIGGAIGIAVLVTIATSVTGNSVADGAQHAQALVDGFQASFAVQTAILLVTAVTGVAIGLFAREAGQLQGVPLPA